MQLVDEGEPLYAMTVGHATAAEFADGLIGGTDVASTLEFRQLREKPAAATVEEIKVVLPEIEGTLGPPWQEVDRDVMGELDLRLYLQEQAGPLMAELAAESWAGDSYALLRRGPDGPYLLVIQTAWDDEEEADQFWTLFLVAMSHQVDLAEDVQELLGEPAGRWWHGNGRTVFARQDGEEVLILIGPDRQTLEAATGALESAPVTG